MTELAKGHTARDGALRRAIQKHGPAYLLLVGLARSLALTAGAEGITVADLREAARTQWADDPRITAALPPDTRGAGRRTSWLGGVLSKAGLIPTDRVRRSHIPGTHGNRNVVHIHPEYRKLSS